MYLFVCVFILYLLYFVLIRIWKVKNIIYRTKSGKFEKLIERTLAPKMEHIPIRPLYKYFDGRTGRTAVVIFVIEVIFALIFVITSDNGDDGMTRMTGIRHDVMDGRPWTRARPRRADSNWTSIEGNGTNGIGTRYLGTLESTN